MLFAGWLDEHALARCYRDSTAFVHPSHYEGFGIVLLEAASFGLPLVVSDGGSLPEVVGHGEYGLVFRRGDVAGLQAILQQLFHDADLRSRLSRQSAALYGRASTWLEVGATIWRYLQQGSPP